MGHSVDSRAEHIASVRQSGRYQLSASATMVLPQYRWVYLWITSWSSSTHNRCFWSIVSGFTRTETLCATRGEPHHASITRVALLVESSLEWNSSMKADGTTVGTEIFLTWSRMILKTQDEPMVEWEAENTIKKDYTDRSILLGKYSFAHHDAAISSEYNFLLKIRKIRRNMEIYWRVFQNIHVIFRCC